MFDKKPSYAGLGSSSKTVLRTIPKKEETKIETNNKTSVPSPRGHA